MSRTLLDKVEIVLHVLIALTVVPGVRPVCDIKIRAGDVFFSRG